MPQPRQRIVFCDCLDCVEQPAATDVPTTSSAANEAAAKQEPPPKCLLLHLSGVLLPGASSSTPTILEGGRLPHLDKATRDGCLTLLAATPDQDTGVEQACAELEQLLARPQPPPGSVNTPHTASSSPGAAAPSSLQQRFKGLQVVVASSSPAAAAYAAGLGCARTDHLQQLLEAAAAALSPAEDSSSGRHGAAEATTAAAEAVAAAAAAKAVLGLEEGLPPAAEVAAAVLQQLGLQDPAAGSDMVLLHFDANHLPGSRSSKGSSSTAAPTAAQLGGCTTEQAVQVLTWFDRVLRYINNEPLAKEALLLVVLLTPPPGVQLPPPAAARVQGQANSGSSVPWLQPGGRVITRDIPGAPATPAAAGQLTDGPQQQQQRPAAAVLRPKQSWQLCEGGEVAADPLRPLLCLRRLPGVIRRDSCSRLSLEEAWAQGGMGPLLLERLLPELAYKMGRAPKYGA